MMWNSRICLGGFAVALVAAVAGSAVLAGEPSAPTPPTEEEIVQAWGKTHPDCAEWTDACLVCRRDGEIFACSTPGPACLPEPVVCRAPLPGTKL